ncbi:hypothetical protein [Leucobacter komagatae]|uniref:Uncharacterized protein n=1 Tax=Leucobacter komagatae TaxID=55969 RepID=A0A0D0HYD3_9MICO|nr:hypothetical protein [Leucobacter komagatae]KIP52581.1 hypothetical protein SD72_08480 [Leucobacter komagatae]
MGEQSDPQPAQSSIPLEIAVALVAAGLSWLAVPPSGTVMHWDFDGVAGWSMNAAGYATATAVVTFLLGRVVTQLVARTSGFDYWWIATVAVGVLMAGYPAVGRVVSGPGSFVSAAVLAVAAYFALLWIAFRRRR